MLKRLEKDITIEIFKFMIRFSNNSVYEQY
jgi:hypothetical protein